jgi:methyl-accepting chemotaxis protein
MKLKFKLSLLVIFIMVVAITGIALLLLSSFTKNVEEMSLQSMQWLAADRVENWRNREEIDIRELRTIAKAMGDYELMPAEIRRNSFNAMLEGMLMWNPDLVSVYTIWKPNAVDGMNSRYAISWTKENGKAMERTATDIENTLNRLNGPLALKDRVEAIPYTIDGKDSFVIIMQVPIINSRTSQVVGAVGIHLNIAVIQRIALENIHNFDEIAGMAIFQGKDGMIMGHLVEARIGKRLIDVEATFGNKIKEANQAVLDGKPFNLRTYSTVIKTMVRLILLPIKIGDSDSHWTMMAVMPETVVLAKIKTITQLTITIAVIAILITAIILFVVFNGVTKPIVKVTNAIRDISEGEGNLTHILKIESKDEIGDLARYFNKLMSVIRIPIDEVKKTVTALNSVSEELASISRELASGSEGTAVQSTTVASTTEQMAANINAMASGAEEASVNANEVAHAAETMSDNMNTIAAAIEEMSASISEITNNADKARSVAEDATAKSSEATDTMKKLGIAAKEIGQVTTVIKKIADKTNLLALNATIEAASAGESGKGFAVVASEIKELATQSAKSADDIAQRIDGIQHESSDAIKVISEASDIIVKINQAIEFITSHVKQQMVASNEIANNVSQANLGARRVASAVTEVAKSAHDISHNAGEAAKGASEVNHNVGGMSQAAKDVSGGASQVKHSAGNLSKMADHLRIVMDKFKV